jgi:hypothetical protein
LLLGAAALEVLQEVQTKAEEGVALGGKIIYRSPPEIPILLLSGAQGRKEVLETAPPEVTLTL